MSADAPQPASSATPILDRLVPLPTSSRADSKSRTLWRPPRSLTLWTYGLGLIVAIPILLIQCDRIFGVSIGARILDSLAGEWSGAPVAWTVVSILVTLPLALVIHELGHLLGGWCAGFKFRQLRLGALQIDSPFHVSFQSNAGTGYDGAATMVPTRMDGLRWRAFLFAAAGPGINVLCAATVRLLPFEKDFFWVGFMIASLALAVRQMFPIPSTTVLSDGRRIWMLLFDPPRTRRWLALMRLETEIDGGVPPESYSPALLADAVAPDDDDPDTFWANLIAYLSAFQRHADDQAGMHLETCLRMSHAIAPDLRAAMITEAAVFQARRRKHAEHAEAWGARLPRSPRMVLMTLRVDAAILEVRGDRAGALEKLKVLEAESSALPATRARVMSLRWIARWRAELAPPRE